MKQDPTRGGGSTLSPAYSAALEELAKQRSAKKRSWADSLVDAAKTAGGALISPVVTVADIAAAPIEAIPGVPTLVDPASVRSYNLFKTGGQSTQHVAGDAYQLARSIITGKDTLSESPSARAYQAAGGGLAGALAAAGPYLELGSYAVPAAMTVGRGAGVVAPKPTGFTPLTAGQVDASRPSTPYRVTRNALAEDMAQATEPRPILEPIRPSAPPQPKPKPLEGEQLAQYLADRDAYQLQREAERTAAESLGATQRADNYQRFFNREGFGGEQTAQPGTDWSKVNLLKEVDIQQSLFDKMDVLLLSPELQNKAAAQAAFRRELIPFLERNGLIADYASHVFSTYPNRSVQQIADIEVFGSLFDRVPQTKQLYIDTMRAYGIGDLPAPAAGRTMRIRNKLNEYLDRPVPDRDAGVLVFGGNDRPSSPSETLALAQTNLETTKAARRKAREALGIEVQDVDFPSLSGSTKPMIVDSTEYGVFGTDGMAWEELGSQQISAGVNAQNLPKEMHSLRKYFSNQYHDVQEYLRGSLASNELKNDVQNIDRIFSVTPPTTHKFKVFRGVRSGVGPLNSEFVGAFYRTLKPGQLIVEPGYLSTSISESVAQDWASNNVDDILLVINVPEGSLAINPIASWERGLMEIDDHLNAPYEQELLFNRGTVLRVVQNDGGVIQTEIVPAHELSTSPLSASNIKESLLNRYSYKELAEIVQDVDQRTAFYEAFLSGDKDLKKMVSRLRWPESGIKEVANMVAELRLNAFDDVVKEVANMVAELRLNAFDDVGDYELFRDAAFLFEDGDGMLNAGKSLLAFLKTRKLLEPEMLTFIKNNLEEIIEY